MSLVKINWHPTRKQVRDFGKMSLVFLTVIALLLYRFKGLQWRWALCICAGGLAIYISSRICIALTKAFYVGLTALTMPIGYAVSFILMAVVFFLIITPIGLVFRLTGRDPLRRKFDPAAKSYWIRHHPADNLKRYFSQF